MTIALNHKFVAKAMGTATSLHIDDVCDAEVAEQAWRSVVDLLWGIEQKFSTFIETSEISRISRGELHLLDASREVIEVFDACTWLEHASNGAFRARRPDGTLDPAGFVKGWATQRASRLLTEQGLNNWYLSVGGDIQTAGRQSSGELWSVGIVDPTDDQQVRCIVEIPEGFAIATSGVAARGRHIWDGRTDQFVSPLLSFSVVGPDLMWADAFATAGFVMGAQGSIWVEGFDRYQAIAISAQG
jgi:thiamine biosynthesis lipoprotein